MASEHVTEELDVLKSIYPPPEFVLELSHDARRLTLQRAIDGLKVMIELPIGYPLHTDRPKLSVGGAVGITRARLASINEMLAAQAAEMHDGPCIMELLQAAMDAADAAAMMAESGVSVSVEGSAAAATDAGSRLKRVWAHMHFVKGENDRRRREICCWAADAGIYGICKPGFPRCMYLEGLAEAVDACVARFKSEQWNNFDVRAEENVDLSLAAPAVDGAAGGAGSGGGSSALSPSREVLLLLPDVQEVLKDWWAEAIQASRVAGSASASSPRVILLPEEPQDASMAVFAAAMAAMGRTSVFKSALLRS